MGPMSADDQEWAKEIEEAHRQDEMDGLAGMGPRAEECLASWKENRPQMYARLKRMGLLEKMASVAENRFHDVTTQLMNGGMPPMDARREASSELMLEPEDDGEVFDDPIERREAEAIEVGDLWYQVDLARERAVANKEPWDEDDEYRWADWVEDELEKWRKNRQRELRNKRRKS